MDHKVNNIQLAWKLACMLSTYRICNTTVGFLKYEFNNKLLGNVILLRVTLSFKFIQFGLFVQFCWKFAVKYAIN